ncbi:MAG: Dabb family protein [Lachnospiraceae bacterium]|nr:Dabb family protein [Lachnospiraceae bacterium]
MVKHVILWKLKEELTGAEKETVKAGIKSGLEGLQGQIPGLLSIKVNTNPLASSNCDVMLDSAFVDEASLKEYAVHPAHVEVANTKVRPFTASRTCMDYEVSEEQA